MYILFSSCQLALFGYPDWGFSVLFPELHGRCQGITCKDGARPAFFPIRIVNCVVLVVNCVVLCMLFLCKCLLYYCHRISTQLQLTNISYHNYDPGVQFEIRRTISFSFPRKPWWGGGNFESNYLCGMVRNCDKTSWCYSKVHYNWMYLWFVIMWYGMLVVWYVVVWYNVVWYVCGNFVWLRPEFFF